MALRRLAAARGRRRVAPLALVLSALTAAGPARAGDEGLAGDASCLLQVRPADVASPQADLPHPPTRGSAAKALFATMSFPTDVMSVEPMVPHWMHTLGRDARGSVTEFVVLDNRPPWWTEAGPQEDGYRRLQDAGVARVAPVDYALGDDAGFLGRFFNLSGGEQGPTSIRSALVQRNMPEEDYKHQFSNWMGMLHFMDRCESASSATELCIYFDPDIFLYRRERGILDLAPAAFRQNPKLVALSPPTQCSLYDDETADGSCPVKSQNVAWQRHLIVNRTRLLDALPLQADLAWFTKPTFNNIVNFEFIFSRSLKNGMLPLGSPLGLMVCGWETFIKHPPHVDDDHPDWNASRLLAELALADSGTTDAERGQQVLTERIEAGRIPRASSEECWNRMFPSEASIKAGMAW